MQEDQSIGSFAPLQSLLVHSKELNQKPSDLGKDGLVSFQAELPIALQEAMTRFIERYPNWDQYRLIQAALAGFLVQNGVETRQITRLYVGNMFGSKSLVENCPAK